MHVKTMFFFMLGPEEITEQMIIHEIEEMRREGNISLEFITFMNNNLC